MRFQKSEGSFIVTVKRSEFPGAKKHWPSELTLGTISKARGVDVWPAPSGTQVRGGKPPPGWEATARRLLVQIAQSGRVLGALKTHRRLARSEGSFIVKFSGGTQSAFDDSKEAHAFAERKLLRMPPGSQAKFYRRGVSGRTTWSDGRPITGVPWTEPFDVLETYIWNGQKRVGMAGANTRHAGSRSDPARSRKGVAFILTTGRLGPSAVLLDARGRSINLINGRHGVDTLETLRRLAHQHWGVRERKTLPKHWGGEALHTDPRRARTSRRSYR